MNLLGRSSKIPPEGPGAKQYPSDNKIPVPEKECYTFHIKRFLKTAYFKVRKKGKRQGGQYRGSKTFTICLYRDNEKTVNFDINQLSPLTMTITKVGERKKL